MKDLSFFALRQLQLIHDFPGVSRFADCSDSPAFAIWEELIDAGYAVECQGYTKVGEEYCEGGTGYDITPAGNAYLLEFSKKLEEVNVSSIFINKAEYKTLKKLKRCEEMPVESEMVVPLVLAGVANFRFVESKNGNGGCIEVCSITNTGRRYLEYRRTISIRTWLPIILSTLALISSFIIPLLLTA